MKKPPLNELQQVILRGLLFKAPDPSEFTLLLSWAETLGVKAVDIADDCSVEKSVVESWVNG